MALNGVGPELSASSSISLRGVTLRIPMVRKGAKSLTADPLSLLAAFYAPGKTSRELRTILDNVSLEIEDGYRLALSVFTWRSSSSQAMSASTSTSPRGPTGCIATCSRPHRDCPVP